MDGSTLPAIDALPSYNAISKAPRAAGYRGSDFVLLALFGPRKMLASRRLAGAKETLPAIRTISTPSDVTLSLALPIVTR